MRAALQKAGAIEITTFKQAESNGDPLAQGRAVFRRLIKYVESRPDGDAIASRLLGGDNLRTEQQSQVNRSWISLVLGATPWFLLDKGPCSVEVGACRTPWSGDHGRGFTTGIEVR